MEAKKKQYNWIFSVAKDMKQTKNHVIGEAWNNQFNQQLPQHPNK